VDAAVPPIEELSRLVKMATEYFRSGSEKKREKMKSLIRDIRQHEKEADILEREFKAKVFTLVKDALTVYHLIHLAEIVGSIADHAQNASDRMRAMIAR